MLKKRLIGVITVLDGWAIQSFSYKKYLPLGKPKILAKNLENWGADEILIQSINRSRKNLGPDYELLKSISNLSLSTPLTYAGGITSKEDAVNVIKAGCERICIDNLLQSNINKIKDISLKLGSQALIASIPVYVKNDKLLWFNYKDNTYKDSFSDLESIPLSSLISEIFLIDKNNEGLKNAFDKEILNLFPITNIPLILFGGINNNEQIKNFFKKENVSSIAVGNSLNYKEHMIQNHKKELMSKELREYNFKKSFY